MGDIPWDKIVVYGHHHELERDMVNVFVAVIRAMDNSFREFSDDVTAAQARVDKAASKHAGKKSKK